MDFVAIDFETATSLWTSICSMGICVVKNNKIVETKGMLFRPVPFEFNDYNTAIHGITPQMVWNKPAFCDCWNEIKPYIEGQLVVAHNASFDIGALKKTLEFSSITLPAFDYLCTVKLSQKAYPHLPSHKLNALGEALDIKFSHHTACDDAYACAMVLLHIINDFGVNSKEEIIDKFDIGIGKMYPGFVEPCRKDRKRTPAVK